MNDRTKEFENFESRITDMLRKIEKSKEDFDAKRKLFFLKYRFLSKLHHLQGIEKRNMIKSVNAIDRVLDNYMDKLVIFAIDGELESDFYWEVARDDQIGITALKTFGPMNPERCAEFLRQTLAETIENQSRGILADHRHLVPLFDHESLPALPDDFMMLARKNHLRIAILCSHESPFLRLSRRISRDCVKAGVSCKNFFSLKKAAAFLCDNDKSM